MKRCPACQNTYTDDSLQFCLQDGVPLENAQNLDDGPETVVRSEAPRPVTVEITPEQETEMATRSAFEAQPEPARGSRTFIAIFVTALVMVLLFGIIGTSAYLFVNREKTTGSASNLDSSRGNGTESGIESNSVGPNSETKPGPTNQHEPKPTPSPEKGTPEPNPTSTPDETTIKKDVSDRIYSWTSLAENRNLGPYMNFYGDRIDYYRKRSASKAFVRNDKRKAFTKYSTIKISISRLNVTPSKDGQTAEAVFDKEWLFADSEASQTGKVRTRLVFRNIGGEWKIVSERDLKVYFVSK